MTNSNFMLKFKDYKHIYPFNLLYFSKNLKQNQIKTFDLEYTIVNNSNINLKDTATKFNEIGLKELYPLIFKI